MDWLASSGKAFSLVRFFDDYQRNELAEGETPFFFNKATGHPAAFAVHRKSNCLDMPFGC